MPDQITASKILVPAGVAVTVDGSIIRTHGRCFYAGLVDDMIIFQEEPPNYSKCPFISWMLGVVFGSVLTLIWMWVLK